jgi:hypothetical protein
MLRRNYQRLGGLLSAASFAAASLTLDITAPLISRPVGNLSEAYDL